MGNSSISGNTTKSRKAGRILLNLTPLLDLLLILIFASQLNTWIVAAETSDRADSEITQLRIENNSQLRELADIDAKLAVSQSEADEMQAEVASLLCKISKLEKDFDASEKRTALAISLLLKIGKTHQRNLSSDEVSAISEIADKFSFLDSNSLHAFSRYNHVRKLTTFWKIDFPNDFRLSIGDDDNVREVFLSENISEDTSSLEMAFQQLATPRKVVFVFFSYSNVLIRRRDSLRLVLRNLVQSKLPKIFNDSLFYLVEEGYGRRK